MDQIKSTNRPNVNMISSVWQNRNFPAGNWSSRAYPSRTKANPDVQGQWKLFHLILKYHCMVSR